LYDVNDNAYESDVWGVRRVDLPYDVSPTEKITLNFSIRAPFKSGVYNCRWRMSKAGEFFGEATPVMLVNVTGDEYIYRPPPYSYYNNSTFENQSVPAYMTAGQKYKVLVTIKNTGSSTWLPASTAYPYSGYKLGVVNDYTYASGTTDWGASPVLLSRPIEPGVSVTLEFEVLAPSAPGTYNFQWQMMQDGIAFGDRTQAVIVNVSSYGQSYMYNSSSFVDQTHRTSMKTNRTYRVWVTFTNSGTSVWAPGSYHLVYYVDPRLMRVTVNPWGADYISITESVSPGQTVMIPFRVKAPSDPGTYHFQWSMASAGSTFGDPSRAVQIYVSRYTTD
jgi:hypothetical protein